MIWSREQAKALIDRALAFRKADELLVSLRGGERGNVRFARNTATTAGASSGYTLAVTANIGKRSGTTTTSTFDDVGLERTVRAAEEIARLSPENPEAMPVLGPQQFGETRAFFDDVAGASPEWRAGVVGTALELSRARDVVSAGFVETSASIRAVGTSKGLFGYGPFTSAAYNVTARTPDSTGSGWASRSFNELSKIDSKRVSETAIDKAVRSKSPSAVEPGKYTVVLEPAAMADLIAFMMFSGNARQADEGRSFFSKKGGGNRVGEPILNDRVRIFSDPAYPTAPGLPFDNEGLPIARIDWIEGGVLKNLLYSRFWAQKQEKTPTPIPSNIIMEGGNATIEELIKGTDRGILVTRFWYIRPLEPQTILLTGLTRDGLFLIEKGQVTRPIKNMRWNESPIVAFNNIDAMTPAERIVSGEGIGADGLSIVCPAARVREFSFTSASDAV